MSTMIYNILAVVLSATILYGIHLMSSPKTAVRGNQIGAVSMAIAIVVTLLKDGTLTMPTLWVAMAIGSFLGLYISIKVKMIQMPQYVALLNGFGGAASALVALMVLVDSGAPDLFSKSTAGLALLVGIITLTGSLVAAGKLHQVLAQRPVVLKNHSLLCNASILIMLVGLVALTMSSSNTPVMLSLFLLVLGGAFGVLFTIRVGGADMPVTISLLNSLSGVAGAIAGLAIADPLLVAVGGIVGASGLLLTQIMCRAMNRSLMDILLGKTSVSTQGAPKTAAPAAATAPAKAAAPSSAPSPAEIVRAAKKVIIIPGYGMALAQAQHKVKALAESFEANGAHVDYAIHPVAGRMPGHMNVLLAEAGVDYEKLLEMDGANPLFPDTDLVVIVGANDVVNPAAREAEGTPIYGMPILDASKAKHIIICNYDLKPGYAGVDNPLYVREDVTMLLGDANGSVDKITAFLNGTDADTTADAAPAAASPDTALHTLLHSAKKVIIIPGYGMALAQAQHKVKALAESFEAKGVVVDYAIHPVAGRMPGHMNVLLAEAGVDYEKLLEMDAANPLFAGTDLVIIVGANDVVNPAAREAEGTPIYGMPILDANKAKNIIVCNYDLKPGYAGVDNPLYTSSNVTMLLGDANDSVDKLVNLLLTEQAASPAPAASTGAAALPALLQSAKKVIIIPGYGMALAQAQHKVKTLAESFEAKGIQVDYAIHPVAGRMPGHMNVLLAEAGVDYEKLLEMDAANPLFAETDLVVIVGANDVVNPAAREAEGTPIYGMPILDACKAKNIVICNYDLKPGYAGVDNPLYTSPSVTMLLGDANNTVDQLIAALSETVAAPAATACTCGCAAHSAASQDDQLANLLGKAKKVMIIPGYGMALAQAQHKVKSLADKLEAKGATVDYAIHPVAGRMPGHMNVLLAEADVDYEKLLEMDAVNPQFASADLAIVVGANDVINPAAIVAEGTPIYGMPILRVDEAKNIIICNYDLKPGYAGVDNPLYSRSDVIMLLGDANDTVAKLIQALG